MTVVLASGNEHKRRELEAVFRSTGLDCRVRLPRELGIEFDVEENGATFLENALIKARALFSLIKSPVMADDSGLVVDALDGRPGIFSARYGAGNGGKITAEARNRLLLKELKESGVAPPWKARFVCAMVLLLDGDRFFSVRETLEGSITGELRGSGGFGYDPLLFPEGSARTVAELGEEEKNRISHRGKAAAAIAALLSAP